MLLSDFRSLGKDIKTLATRYWLSVILEHLQLQNLNQLSKLTQRLKGQHRSAQCSASFLYKKMKEGSIDNEAKIKLMDELVPGSSLCLTNPLWRLLDSDRTDTAFIDSVLFSLNAHITACLFEPLTDMAHPKRTKSLVRTQIKTIASFNAPDALTCLLVLSLVHKDQKKLLEKYAFQLFVRLTIFTPLKSIRNELYTWIYLRFFERSTDELNKRFQNEDFDCIADHFGSKKHLTLQSAFLPALSNYLDELDTYYSSLADDMASLQLIKNTPQQKMLFTHAFDNTDRGWIVSGINRMKKEDGPRVTDQLFKLLERMNYIKRYQ